SEFTSRKGTAEVRFSRECNRGCADEGLQPKQTYMFGRGYHNHGKGTVNHDDDGFCKVSTRDVSGRSNLVCGIGQGVFRCAVTNVVRIEKCCNVCGNGHNSLPNLTVSVRRQLDALLLQRIFIAPRQVMADELTEL